MTTPETPPLKPEPGKLLVAVVTPEGNAFEGHAESVVVPAFDGEVAFLADHAPFVGAIGVGQLRVKPLEGDLQRWYLEGGVVQVLAGEVTILAEQVTPAGDVKETDADADLEKALQTTPTSDEAFAERDRALESARVRKRIAHPPSA